MNIISSLNFVQLLRFIGSNDSIIKFKKNNKQEMKQNAKICAIGKQNVANEN